eukprot:12894179-Prorocentrum_lima.AAC.1
MVLAAAPAAMFPVTQLMTPVRCPSSQARQGCCRRAWIEMPAARNDKAASSGVPLECACAPEAST